MKQLMVVFSVLLLSLSSCVTTSIRSNKSLSYNEKLDKVFVLVKGTDFTNSSFKPFFSKLYASLETKGVASGSHYIDPLSLKTDEEIQSLIDKANPNLVMVIEQREVRRFTSEPIRSGTSILRSGATFDIKITKYNSEKPIWRASLDAEGSYGISQSARKASERVIEKLEADGLL